MKFDLRSSGIAKFLIDGCAEKGISRVASKVVGDFNKITGLTEEVTVVTGELPKTEYAVLFATVGNSQMLAKLEKEGLFKASSLEGKWEVYSTNVYHDVDGIKNLLVIAGSDKLGTIYGMFELSNKMGVSPLVYWADSVVEHHDTVAVEIEDGFESKEPSVKFRGFFINDEWPCYGNWTWDHFGGFTAEMYDHVFELLLRLKGNYLWPAMWSSSFALDGPGLASYELADEYGIYIGNSHHEPCLRAGEEYSKVRGKGSIYGDAWNFHTNTEGITRFWRDSLMERGGFTSMITVGMRGEADSKILGENATLKDNIDLLKKVIVCQKELIREAEQKFNKKYPMMLALYKEVEPFYYGDANTEGLCDWDELSDVTMMLCEDNYGYLRTVPDDRMRNHPAGFGMYYHVDYHGSPISYEWINSTPLTKMWEQMSQAYDYGIRNVWILNVGDLKHNEFPLSYFLNLAYDFDKWGTSAPNTTFEYTKQLMKLQLGEATEEVISEAAEILTETVRINGLRRPEALNSDIYSPCHFHEADRMLKRAAILEAREEALLEKLNGQQKVAWISLTGFQTKAAINLLRMHLYAGKNALLAGQGRKSANAYAEMITETLSKDAALKEAWAGFVDGKWKGMELASHIGFTKWNEDGCRNPLRITVEPFNRPRMYVVRTDDEKVYDKVYGPAMEIKLDDFKYEGIDTASVVICNNGIGSFDYKVEMPEVSWLTCDKVSGKAENEEKVTFTCNRALVPTEETTVKAKISGGDTVVMVAITAGKLSEDKIKALPAKTFLPGRFGYVIDAKNYAKATGAPTILEDYGVYGFGVKYFPTTASYVKGSEPVLTYHLYSEENKSVTLETVFAPTNPLTRDGILEYGVSVNEGAAEYKNTVPAGYRAGEGSDITWAMGALNHRRPVRTAIELKKGVNEVNIHLPYAGLVPLRLNIFEKEMPVSYLGGPENEFVR